MRLIVVLLLILLVDTSAWADKLSVWIGMSDPTYGEDEGIFRATLDTQSGQLSKPELAAKVHSPSFLAFNVRGDRLYSICRLDDAGGVAAFEVGDNGRSIRLLNTQSTRDSEPCHLAVDPTGRCLFTAQYVTGSVCVFPLAKDGTIRQRSAIVRHTGSGPNRARQEGPHPHWVGIDPANRFLFVPDLGLDQVAIYRTYLDTGTIERHGEGRCISGAGPRHMKFHPNGKFAYVVNELDLSVSAFRFEPSGTLERFQTISTLPEKLREVANSASEIRIHPSARFLYAANRGHDSIAAFSVDPDSGKLAFIEREAVRGSHPRNFNIDPTGQWLLAAGRDSNTISLFHIDAKSGGLVYTGTTVNSPSPFCIEFRPAEQANESASAASPHIDELIANGDFTAAEKLLKEQIDDPSAPVTSAAAIQLEILRRTRQDFLLSNVDVLAQLRQSISGATQSDVDRWREAGDLQARTIDGEHRYFRQAVANLFRFNKEARRRQTSNAQAEKKFDLNAHVAELVRLAESADRPEIHPVKHNVRYELVVKKGHPRIKPGAQVRAWLPFPQEYRQQQHGVKLIRSVPPHSTISKSGSPHRSIYFETTITDAGQPPRFTAEFEFISSAFCPKLDPAKVAPYDVDSALYREYTAERPPHIVFTPDVKKLAVEIVGDETNPLEKARRMFRWVSGNIPWCSEMEYSIIPSISAKALAARRGDCGVQGLTFITLCRAAGVPAHWQSGWQIKPGNWNMHDWSEIYVEPWGWLAADASYGVRDHADPRVREFFCGHMDPYRLIVNLDYARTFDPPKTSFRSEPNDFQRGEIEIDGHNLYFGEWDWNFQVKSTPLAE